MQNANLTLLFKTTTLNRYQEGAILITKKKIKNLSLTWLSCFGCDKFTSRKTIFARFSLAPSVKKWRETSKSLPIFDQRYMLEASLDPGSQTKPKHFRHVVLTLFSNTLNNEEENLIMDIAQLTSVIIYFCLRPWTSKGSLLRLHRNKLNYGDIKNQFIMF